MKYAASYSNEKKFPILPNGDLTHADAETPTPPPMEYNAEAAMSSKSTADVLS
jgi:hypothetical protein